MSQAVVNSLNQAVLLGSYAKDAAKQEGKKAAKLASEVVRLVGSLSQSYLSDRTSLRLFFWRFSD